MCDKRKLSDRIADALVTYRWELLALTVLLATLAIFPASRVIMDRSVATMFAEDNPLVPPFRKLQRAFGGNAVVLAVYEDPELFSKSGAGLERLAQIRSRLSAVAGVKGVMSSDMILGDRVLDLDTQIPVQVRSVFQGLTHGADGKTAAVACMLHPLESAPVPRHATIAQLRAEIADLPDGLAPGTLAGEPAMIEDAFVYVDQDGQRLFTITTALLSLVILLCFRSWRWVIVPVAVVPRDAAGSRAAAVSAEAGNHHSGDKPHQGSFSGGRSDRLFHAANRVDRQHPSRPVENVWRGTLALIVGFAALATSNFVPTIYFGVLVSISMLGALFGNLVWLPLLLRLFQPSAIRAEPAAITAAVQKG